MSTGSEDYVNKEDNNPTECFIERYMDDSIYIVNDYNSALNIVNGIIKFLIQVK